MNESITVEHLPWNHIPTGNNQQIYNYVISKHNSRTPKKFIIFFFETDPIMCKKNTTNFYNYYGEWHPLALLQKNKNFKYHSIRYVTVPCMRNLPFNYIILNSMKKELFKRKSDLQNIIIKPGYKNLPENDDIADVLFTLSKNLKKDLSNKSIWNIIEYILELKRMDYVSYLLTRLSFILEEINIIKKNRKYKNSFDIRGRFNFQVLRKISLQYREIQTLQNIEHFLISNIGYFKKLFPSSKNVCELFQNHFKLYLLFGGAHTFNDEYFKRSSSKIRIKVKKIRGLLKDCQKFETGKEKSRTSLRKSWERYNLININLNEFYKTYCNHIVWQKTINRKIKGARDFKLLYQTKKDELDCVKYNCAVLFEISFDKKIFTDIFYPGINSLRPNCIYRFTELGCRILPVSVFKRNSNTLFVFDFQEISFLIYNKNKIKKSEADKLDKNFNVNAAKKTILKCYGIFKNNPNLSEYHLKELDLLAVQIDCYLK